VAGRRAMMALGTIAGDSPFPHSRSAPLRNARNNLGWLVAEEEPGKIRVCAYILESHESIEWRWR
jgi:hypothetical protein